jgi:protein phosphatase
MGSTLTMAVLEGDRFTLAHVGDSRAYLWRDACLRQLTEDHSVPGALLKQGRITAEEVTQHPHRHILYRCLGLKPSVEVDLHPSMTLRSGDMLLLCSDGLWDMLHPDGRIAEILGQRDRPARICKDLIDAANEAGGEDNITVVVVRVEAFPGVQDG